MTSSRTGAGPSRPIVCGHRGAAAVSPENTLASFARAAERGATWVEFDVRPTGDGQLVIHHDPDTATGQNVATVDRVALDPAIPTFAELVQAMPDIGLDIEIKTDDVGRSLDEYVALVAAQIDSCVDDQAASDPQRVMVTSFDVQALSLFRELRPDVATGLLFFEPGVAATEIAVEAGHVAIAPWYKLVTVELVTEAHDAGLDVATWTVNKPDTVAAVAAAGVDMIIGDDPAVIVEALGA